MTSALHALVRVHTLGYGGARRDVPCDDAAQLRNRAGTRVPPRGVARDKAKKALPVDKLTGLVTTPCELGITTNNKSVILLPQ